jgi:hypothetical protein
MFRKIAIVFVLILMLSLAGCGGAAKAPLPTLVEVTPLPAATDTPIPTAEPTAADPPPTEPPTAEPTAEPTATTDPQDDLLWRDVTTETIGGTSQWTNKVELADINGDGWVDLLFANGGYYDAPEPPLSSFVFLNHGPDQPYEEVSDAVLGPEGMLARVIKVRDVNNDGLPDIMVGTTFQTQSRLFLGQGDGAFTEVTSTHLPQQVASIGDLEFGDVDGDGDLDMVLADWGPGSPMANEGGRTLLWLNDGEGRFIDVTAGQMPEALVRFSWELEFVDVDNDFDLDILVSCKQCAGSFLFENDGAGGFIDVTQDSLPRYRNNYDFEAMDLNGDGYLDLITINDGVDFRDRVFINDQTGSFIDGTADLWPRESNPGVDDNMVAFFDYDSDGDAGFLIGSLGSYSYAADRILINDGQGKLTPLPVAELFRGITRGTLGIAVADLNGDNRLDIVEAQGEVAWAEKVYYGQNNLPDTAPPIITLVTTSGQPPTVRARVHDNKSPTMPHDWQSVVVRRTTADGQIIETPMQWYGEYLWRVTLEDASADTVFEVCAIDAAGNEACSP